MTSSRIRQVVGVLLFLTVFFLPLHFHPATGAPQVTKECSCVHGTRTLAALAPAPAGWLPGFVSQLFVPEFADWSDRLSVLTLHIRAPPPALSL